MSCQYCSDSESEGDYEHCTAMADGWLPFDSSALQNIVLAISDKFDFRVVMSEGRARDSFMLTTGLAIAGSVLGKHYGGNLGAAIGGAVGGACGIGVVVMSFREVWRDLKQKLYELLEVVYEYVHGLGLDDYRAAAEFLVSQNNHHGVELASLLVGVASTLLQKKVLSAVTQ